MYIYQRILQCQGFPRPCWFFLKHPGFRKSSALNFSAETSQRELSNGKIFHVWFPTEIFVSESYCYSGFQLIFSREKFYILCVVFINPSLFQSPGLVDVRMEGRTTANLSIRFLCNFKEKMVGNWKIQISQQKSENILVIMFSHGRVLDKKMLSYSKLKNFSSWRSKRPEQWQTFPNSARCWRIRNAGIISWEYILQNNPLLPPPRGGEWFFNKWGKRLKINT